MALKVVFLLVPLSLGLAWFEADPLLVFAASCLTIVPLAGLMAEATEELANYLGPTLGGLVNATLGNAPELIIAGFALSKGLTTVVKASISGSILMNLLLTLGVGMLSGGLGRHSQTFNKVAAGTSASLLALASIGLIVPALFHASGAATDMELSLVISCLLFAVYLLSLVFTLGTHRQLFVVVDEESTEAAGRRGGMKGVVVRLGLVAAALGVISEIMTDSLGPAIKKLGLSEVFAGVVVLASLGNVSELIVVLRFARADKMDLVMGTSVGAATQVAMAVAPLLVFAGRFLGQPMDLQFSLLEVIALTLAVMVTSQFTRDGESHWFEGVMLVAVYLMFATGFYCMSE
jgi:Ca2+:H+ antiporter